MQAALREAEETGLDASGVEVFGRRGELAAAERLRGQVYGFLGWWREPSRVDVVDPDEVHDIYHVAIKKDLLDPEHRISVRRPNGWVSPGFLIGPERA